MVMSLNSGFEDGTDRQPDRGGLVESDRDGPRPLRNWRHAKRRVYCAPRGGTRGCGSVSDYL